MTYLNHVINECLHLHAPAKAATRTRLSNCILPCVGHPDGPIYTHAGRHIFMDFGAMNTDQD
ncbi:putative cytochrome p450 alkane hydroxylase protein [Botrytis fragariae]|uniref:Putative cytochrome p450 alkane hydroxylase protein n=1 Tax=Botrytis fragariae TaxID=1964551 RepID=A0A8H6EP00_9HELO|nr:putative cytochrome p450 alkane hydroxylase protein [Botrytis fragariae]KAF5879242.1 putative cytochrome p450 alkane hydroxylase protein [Botrytis fragariae]